MTLPFFKKGEKVAVVVMPVEDTLEAEDERDWMRFGLENFFRDDSEGDSAYNLLSPMLWAFRPFRA